MKQDNQPTAMRLAFTNAVLNSPNSMRYRTRLERSVESALRRGVGLNTRRQYWSVNRGAR